MYTYVYPTHQLLDKREILENSCWIIGLKNGLTAGHCTQGTASGIITNERANFLKIPIE